MPNDHNITPEQERQYHDECAAERRRQREGDDTKLPDNLRIWDAVKAVPTEFTKPFHPNGDKSVTLTSVAPMYYFQEATKLWGPMGFGWGFEIKDDRLIHDSKGQPTLHVLMVRLWYVIESELQVAAGEMDRFSTFGVGCTCLQYTDDSGQQRWDDDFNKKTLTDAITNALSRLGFGADIRLQSHEGSKYVGRAGKAPQDDPKLDAAWAKVLRHLRDKYADDYKHDTDDQIMAKCTTKLMAFQRRVTPEDLLGLIA